eukprot:9255005-Pyramimonas_sp.AAC.1
MAPVRLSRGANVAHVLYFVVSIPSRSTSIVGGRLRLRRCSVRGPRPFARGIAIAARRVVPVSGPTGRLLG